MKYITQSFNKVKKIEIVNGILCVLSDKKIIINEKNKYFVNFNSETIYTYKNNIFSDENFYYNLLVKELITISELENYFYSNIFFKDKMLFTNNDCKIYSFEKETIIKQFPFFLEGSVCLLFEKNMLIRYSNNISNYEIDTLEKKWEQTFSSLMKEEKVTISNEILEISGTIYFILFGEEKKACFGLDANTGKVLKTIPNVVGELIAENEFIYFLHSEKITIFNTTNDQITTWEIENIMIQNGIDRLWFPRWAVNNGLIYFSQSKNSDIHSGNNGSKFGILDPLKKELIWQHQLSCENGTIGEIKVYNDNIYLHTQDKTLFVFEKE